MHPMKIFGIQFLLLFITISGFSQNITIEKFKSAELVGETSNERILKYTFQNLLKQILQKYILWQLY